MKSIIKIFILFIVINLQANQSNNNIASPFLDLCVFLESPNGLETNALDHGSTGAILDECIIAIQQGMIIIASSILICCLKQVIEKEMDTHMLIQKHLDEYKLFQTYNGNFIIMVPNNKLSDLDFFDCNSNLPIITIDKIKDHSEIDIEELKSIFTIFDRVNALKKSFYLSGHGLSLGQDREPRIANLTIAQYKEFINHLNSINCMFLFISSCYAAGLNMIKAHENLIHKFPIAIGNLTDKISLFHSKVNFKKYFKNLEASLQDYHSQGHFLSTLNFKKALNKLCGDHINNIPWIRLSNSEKFFMFNVTDKAIIIDEKLKSGISLKKQEHLLLCSIHIPNVLKIPGTQIPTIISAIPGQSYHCFKYFNAPNLTLHNLVDCVLKVPYEFTKVFFLKKVQLKQARKTSLTFKKTIIKNILIINRGFSIEDNFDDLFKCHELYFQRKKKYYRILIPIGTKIGYLEIPPDKYPLQAKRTIINSYLKLSEPSQETLNLIGKLN